MCFSVSIERKCLTWFGAVKVAEPLLRVELENAACWSLDWANSEVLAVGCSNGELVSQCKF